MRLILFGPPGAGKGTQAEFIRDTFNIPQISTGELLRNAIESGSPLGLQVQQVVNSGNLVPDNTMISLVKERIQAPDCEKGFILDGFPRTLPQAEALHANNIHLDYVINIQLADDVIVQRLSGRRVHPASGRVYHILFRPPKNQGIDDLTGEPLIQRSDDFEETIRERLRVYHQQTESLVGFYKNLYEKYQSPFYIEVDGAGSFQEVKEKLLASIKSSM